MQAKKIQLSKDKCQFFEVTNLKLILRKHSKFLGMNSLTIPNRFAKLSTPDFSEDTNTRFEIHAHAFVLGFPKCHIFFFFFWYLSCFVSVRYVHIKFIRLREPPPTIDFSRCDWTPISILVKS